MSVLRRVLGSAGTLVTALALVASPAAAETSEQDAAWMVAAHQSNLAEIAAGRAAQEQASSAEVREMGAMLIEDHEALDADLTAAAEELGVDLPEEPSPEQQATLARVQAQQGEAFDAAWIASQIEGHQMTLAAGQEEIAEGQDETVVALARAAAPVVQEHLDRLLQMAEGTPVSVPGGLGAPETPTVLGGTLIGLGLVAVAGSLLLLVRRGRDHA